MTWTLAAFTILALALGTGFAWYERTHPSSKVLALVATLAALAVLGRVAFAPIPNVKPTTDIVVFAGFALGAAPGFAVGAVTALASNVLFGQGPWTPWQMLAWGLCGVLGALLARATKGDPGRWTLAATCAGAGVFYGLLLDGQEWLLYAPERSFGQFAVIEGTSLPFNIAHVVGNVAFALAFGPAMLRILTRFRARCEIDWRPLAPVAGALVLALALAAPALRPAPAQASATSGALRFLTAAQNRDGGWGAAKGARSTPLYTSWALIGQGAARHGRCSTSAVRYLQRTSSAVQAVGDIERTIVALRACRRSAATLARRLQGRQRRDGSFNGLTNQTAFAILALRAAGRSAGDGRVRRAAAFVVRQQNGDGGFSYSRRGAGSGVDDTAAAIQALAAAGRSRRSGPIPRAARYLRARQGADGGFGATRGLSSNAQSTAWVVQGLLAAGIDPDRVRRAGSRTPLAYLRTLANADGSIRYSRTSRQTPVWVTAQALTALARDPFPIG